jgi:hypothetical protein
MLVGDLIERFQDQRLAGEALFSLGDLALTARIVALAAKSNLSAGELVVQSIGHFTNVATDEDWLTLIGSMSRADDPGAVFLLRALAHPVAV